jgi:hypothetical protein
MEAIFKYGNIYVTAPKKEMRSDIDAAEVQELLVWSNSHNNVNLYGGRVLLDVCYGGGLTMAVDGIEIEEISFNSDGECKTTHCMNTNKTAAYLNQIENLGVDTFIENYRTQLQALKTEIEGSAIKLEQELCAQHDEEKSTILKNLRASILHLSCMIFMLLINLNAGLDNHFYSEAYENITNLYF